MPQNLSDPLRGWWGRSHRSPDGPTDSTAGGADRERTCSLQDAALAMRLGCFDEAERVLRRLAPAGRSGDAGWLNLMGVVYESRGDWRRARRFYGKAMRADRGFAPAEQNMRRWYEMFTFGRTRWPVALGDDRAAQPNGKAHIPCKT